MEFWGAEVKAGEPIKVKPDDRNVIHLSQACLGEAKKAADSVVVYGKTNDQKLVLGHLIPGQIPQLNFDLVFHEEFELSHNWKNGSVHFAGYRTMIDDEDERLSDESDESESDEEAEELPVIAKENGKVEKAKPASTKNAVKPESSEKQKVKIEEPTKDDSDEDDSASDDDEIDSDDIMDSSDDDREDESEDEDEETPTPKKPESKKRTKVSEPAKTPVSTKKAKIDATTPQKTDGKKGGHIDTPHPSKKGKTPSKKGKTPATEKSKAQTPKFAGGDFSCGTCSKSFNSDGALQSHSKAKHSAGK